MDQLLPFAGSLGIIVLLALGVGYSFGSIPVGLFIGTYWFGKNVQQLGSGNTGATNLLRVINKKAALVTLLCDICKGACPCLIFLTITPTPFASDLALLAGLFAIIGHVYPIYNNFRGGRGVATALGMIVALSPPLALIFTGLWMIIVAITHYSSIASLISISIIPLIFFILGYTASSIFILLSVAILIIIRHRENIVRLLSGQENTILL